MFGAILVALLAVVLLVVQHPWGHLKYLATVLPVGALISAFWTGPFYLNSAYMTDMGWEKLTNYSDSLFARTQLASQLSDRPGIEYLLVLAAVGALMSFAYCRRGEIFWVAMAVLAGVAFLYVPQSRLWNARLLPFYYLAVYLVGAIAIAEVGRTVARLIASDVHRPPRVVLWITAVVGLCAWLVVLGLPLRTLPFGTIDKDGVTYQWGPLKTKDSSFVTSWANWNFTGYEGKAYYPEYYAVVQQMAKIGKAAGLRPGHVGVLRLPEQLRHADGAHAAAVLDQRLHRLDGGPVLRGVGHHALPLPQPERAVGGAVRCHARTCPTCRVRSPRPPSTSASPTCRCWASATTWPPPPRPSASPTTTTT